MPIVSFATWLLPSLAPPPLRPRLRACSFSVWPFVLYAKAPYYWCLLIRWSSRVFIIPLTPRVYPWIFSVVSFRWGVKTIVDSSIEYCSSYVPVYVVSLCWVAKIVVVVSSTKYCGSYVLRIGLYRYYTSKSLSMAFSAEAPVLAACASLEMGYQQVEPVLNVYRKAMANSLLLHTRQGS